jgi:hypothetical protein
MTDATFTRVQLEEKTAAELKAMCVHELNIPGMTKKTKAVVIDAIMEQYGVSSDASAEVAPDTGSTEDTVDPVTALDFTAHSRLTRPDGEDGDKTTTTITVSSGANSGNFPVVGKTVGAVKAFLKEVLNVDEMSSGLVNGSEVGNDYVLKNGDRLEFLKPAGKKGC